MKLITFKTSSNEENYRLGALVSDNEITDLTSLVSDENLTANDLLKCFDLENDFLEKAKQAISDNDLPKINRRTVEVCAPVPRPSKIICIGLNYRDHAEESGMPIPKSPIIFSKFTNCAIGANQPILLPGGSEQVDYEAELAFVVGRRAKNVRREDALDYVLGYTNFNDVSARDFQFADGQWQRGKSCDTFAPMGEFIATADEIKDPHNLRIQFRLNGETLQDSTTSQLIFKIPEIIEFLSASITLEVGDVIATGTPPGVGFARKPPVFMQNGDRAEVEIEGLGILSNPVKGE
ncbi:MAG TPA: fumarylacetoacetate hydrolase family protein [Pyrinomonadaceae bacterium]|jgi:2-keto-4-pentenoate hydratase/2-oxohepta-3-ene-1,7-dioic acid hydratase in catechol pathway|nr:fumarylacetoacetate hydrolase family protein [Pyrinomonadaceae bacterium]